ncbi:MAG: hypothetical protein ACK4PI_01165 [Tepidisphaerales bacterium]
MAQWLFREYNGYDDAKETTSAEAFEGKSTRGISTDIVREGLQNVLDAKLAEGPARARLTLATLPAHVARRWLSGLEPHLTTNNSGVIDPPGRDEPCNVLLFEDFNTTGLTGDYTARFKPGTKNDFVNFLYNDGLTSKKDVKLGSRGVGKIVFLIASRIRTLFAYTVREERGRRETLLVGKALLKLRDVGEKSYEPACYFLEAWPKEAPRKPVTDADTLRRFRADFGLCRSDPETGLSVIVPYVDDYVTLDALRKSVVEEYAFAILKGELIVELAEGDRLERIDASHLPTCGDSELAARLELMRFAIAHGTPAQQTALPGPGVQKWSEELVPEATRETLREALRRQEVAAVRCQLHIHPKQGGPVPTHFDVFMQHADISSKPLFIRGLLPISDVGQTVPRLRSLVYIPPGPLANFLRAAEGANHTTWSPRSPAFKGQYKQNLGEIDFVSSSVNRLMDVLYGHRDEPVKGVSTSFFFLPRPGGPEKAKAGDGRKEGHDPDNPTPPDTPTEPTTYSFSQQEGGFTIRGKADSPPPESILVRVAYDTIRGSPWAEYDPDDFDFRNRKASDVRVYSSGAEVERLDPGNRLRIRPTADDFEVHVAGFNPALDLIVEHRDESRSRQRKGRRHAHQSSELHPADPAHA